MDSQVPRKQHNSLPHFGTFSEVEVHRPVHLDQPLWMALTLVQELYDDNSNRKDIENNQPQYYGDFVQAIRKLYASGSKNYYLSAAPQYVKKSFEY